MLPKTNKQPPQHNPLSRGARHFNFKSSTVLPKQHTMQDYNDIINSKKVYQSLIKDEIKKLQAMEACVPDPQIQPFHIPLADQKIPHSKSIEGIVENDKAGRNRFQKNNQQKIRKTDPIDVYLDSDVGNKQSNLLSKIVNKFKYQKFFGNLRDNRKTSKQTKAANYFRYENLTKKYFLLLKQICELTPEENSQTHQKLKKYRTLKLAKNLRIFRQLITSMKLRDRMNAYRKTRQFKIKKQTIQFIISKHVFQAEASKLHSFIKHSLFKSFISIQKSRQSIISSKEMLNKARKYRNLSKFISNSSYRLSVKNLNEGLKKIESTIENSKELQRYFKKYSVAPELQAAIQRKFEINNLIQTVQHSIILRQERKFLINLELQFKTKRLKNILSTQRDRKNQSKNVFNLLKDLRIFNKKRIQAKKIFFNNYIANFKQNSCSDIGYRQSLNSCLNGTKQWLIKNKQIFKSEPLRNSSLIPKPNQQSAELLSQFSHPLLKKSLNEILAEESKFKRVPQKYIKKIFLRSLSARYNNNKKLNLVKYANQLLHNNHLLTVAWSVLKDRSEMQRINEQIQQQRQLQEDKQVQLKSQQVSQMLTDFSKKLFIKRLIKDHQYLTKLKELSSITAKKINMQTLGRIAQSTKISFEKKKIHQKLKQCKIVLKEYKINRFLSILKLNQAQAAKTKFIYSQYDHILTNSQRGNENNILNFNQQNLSGLARLVQERRQKIQFLTMLQSSYTISQGSIQVTSLYLRNKLKKMRNLLLLKQECSQIQHRQQEISKERGKKIKKQYFLTFRQNSSSCIQLKRKIENLLNKIGHQSKQKTVQSMLKFSFDYKKYESNLQNKDLVVTFLKICKQKNFLLRLKALRLNEMQKNSIKQQDSKQGYQKKQIQVKKQQTKAEQAVQSKRNIANNRQNAQSSIIPVAKNKSSENSMNLKVAKNQTTSHLLDSPKKSPLVDDKKPSQKQSNLKNSIDPPSQISINNNSSIYVQKQKRKKSPHDQLMNSPHISASSIVQNNSELGSQKSEGVGSEQQDISYEEYRRSLTKCAQNEQQPPAENQHNHNLSALLNRQEYQQHQSSGIKNQNYNKLKKDKSLNNNYSISFDKNQSQNERLDRLLGHESYQQDQYKQNISDQQEQELNINRLPNPVQHNQSESWQHPQIEQQSHLNQQSSEISESQYQYFRNRYQSNLLKKHFKIWKSSTKQKISPNNRQSQRKIQEESPEVRSETLRKIFLGWQMYSRQKQLVRKYLQEYEQQYNYYPQSKEEYQEFKAVAEKA